MSPALAIQEEDEALFGPGDAGFLHRVAELAESYPYRHSIFGSSASAAYVRELAANHRTAGEGWYGVALGPRDLAVVHLAIYGVGNGQNHTLFKLRHPLLSGDRGPQCLTRAFKHATSAAAELRPGSQKLVIFLGEAEVHAQSAAERAGFVLEGVVADYYRLGERCLLMGYTATGAP